MELSHSFTVPAGLEQTWETFGDLASVAECFPGATVTESDGDTFKGTAKVKLGPVAMQYSGQGQVLERDEAAHRMRLEAKGKDKRGNGTAGATVTMSFAGTGTETTVEVLTDLSVTGKPAQFGARMMQEVSDKLLGQFVECLKDKVGASPSDSLPEPTPAEAAIGADAPEATPTVPDPDPGAAPRTSSLPPADRPAQPRKDDALDLGTTVLPVVARMYGKQVGAGVLVLLVLRWLWARRG